MGRYFKFNGNTFNFATNCDVDIKKEYFKDFVFGGNRDQRIYGLTRVTPSLTCRYDLDGLNFLQYVLGSIATGTVTVSDLPEIGTISAAIDNEFAGITQAKIDTWKLTVEEANPVRAEFTAMGKNICGTAPTSYTPNFASPPIMPYNVSVTINTTAVTFSLFELNISNGIDAIFKTSTLPVTLRPTGLEISGKIRFPQYATTIIADGSLRLVLGSAGTIDLATIKVTEIPPKVQGYDLPDVEYSFDAFPAGTTPAIKAYVGSTW